MTLLLFAGVWRLSTCVLDARAQGQRLARRLGDRLGRRLPRRALRTPRDRIEQLYSSVFVRLNTHEAGDEREEAAEAAERAFLEQAAQQLGAALTDAQRGVLSRFVDLLLEHNRRVNLTAIRSRQGVYEKHLSDALVLPRLIDQLPTPTRRTGLPQEHGSTAVDTASLRLIDMGSGGGLPGVPLAIFRPSLQVTLNDAARKKVDFLQRVRQELKLNALRCEWARAEEMGQMRQHRAKYDAVVARALAEMRVLVELTLPLVAVGGHVLAMKALSKDLQELRDSHNALELLGGRIVDVVYNRDERSVLDDGRQLGVVVVEKRRSTPGMYPRLPGTPSKRPL